MADGKKSFVLYCDLKHTVDLLDDALAGKLLKHLLRYVNDENPETDDLLLKIAFEPIKRQLKRDLKDWEQSVTKRSDAGALGNLKRWHLDIYEEVIKGKITIEQGVELAKNNKQSHSDNVQSPSIPIVANIAVNGNGNVTVNDTVTDIITKITDAEKEILKSEVWFQGLCTGKGKSLQEGKDALRNFHLFLVEKEKYPQTKKQIFAGFERWLLNEKKYTQNGKQQVSGTNKSVGKTIEFDKP